MSPLLKANLEFCTTDRLFTHLPASKKLDVGLEINANIGFAKRLFQLFAF